jgi:hypothetical protein
MRENGHHNRKTGKYRQETDGPSTISPPKHTSCGVPLHYLKRDNWQNDLDLPCSLIMNYFP